MINVEINVSKIKHDICIIDFYGTILIEHLTVKNNREDFNTLCDVIEKHNNGSGEINLRIALKDTGHYSVNLLYFFKKQGIFCSNLQSYFNKRILQIPFT